MKGFKSHLIWALWAISAQALATQINHEGNGQVALLPYFTINNNFITNFTVTNTTDRFKAVRVRLHDSHISADLLNINLYLSPHDVWNATLRRDINSGRPNLITEDNSCSYPENPLLQAGITLQNPYAEVPDSALTEGYIEIIEMGDIADGEGPADDGGYVAEIDISGTADGIATAEDRSIVAGLLQDYSGVPADCTVVADAWSAGSANAATVNGFEPGTLNEDGIASENGDPALPYDSSLNAGLVAPSGGISVYGILIDVAQGAAFVEQAVHIDHYTTVAQHYLPDDPVHYRLPSLASGNVREAFITNSLGDARKGDTFPLTEYDTGALQDISPLPSVPMGSNPLPVAAVLSAETLDAPYFVESNINGMTDIVMTYPMRKYGIYNSSTLTNQRDPAAPACTGSLNDGVDDGQAVYLASVDATVQDYPHDTEGAACLNAGFPISSWGHDDGQIFDPRMQVTAYDYENSEFRFTEGSTILVPGYAYPYLEFGHNMALLQGVNVINVKALESGYLQLFGTPHENYPAFLELPYNLHAGWLNVVFDSRYDYQSNSEVSALTEPVGGLGSSVTNSWRGVPVIGFAAMYSEISANSVGETIELGIHKPRD
ncbi:MAG: hypothetical protein ABW095_09350 [Candidatus Thiodiazotropha sp.]